MTVAASKVGYVYAFSIDQAKDRHHPRLAFAQVYMTRREAEEKLQQSGSGSLWRVPTTGHYPTLIRSLP